MARATAGPSWPCDSLKTTRAVGVKSAMKRACLWLVACAGVLAACTPHAQREAGSASEPTRTDADRQELRRAAGKMASVVHDLQSAPNQGGAGAGQSVGNLWMEVNRLKRQGQRVRSIEWYAADLEASMRGGQQDAARRRHLINNLSYEVEALRRR